MNRYDSRVEEIGARIKAERTSMGLSVKAFLLKLYMSESSHKTVLAWERGERLPDLDSLVRMSELFECDVGYLLCDYDERTRDCADVCAVTGLGENAVSYIIARHGQKREMNELNELLSNGEIDRLLLLMGRLSAYKEEMEDEICKSSKYAKEVIAKISLADGGSCCWSSPDDLTDCYTKVKHWRNEIVDHFLHMIDEIYDINRITKEVAGIEEIYLTPRKCEIPNLRRSRDKA